MKEVKIILGKDYAKTFTGDVKKEELERDLTKYLNEGWEIAGIISGRHLNVSHIILVRER